MSLQNFQATVLSANLAVALQKNLVYAGVANTSYEGQLKNLGDKVKVVQVSGVSVGTYVRDQAITAPLLDDAATELVADQGVTWAFSAEDVDAVQRKPEILSATVNEASYKVRDVVDQYLAAMYAQSGLTSYATGTTPWDVTSLNVQDVFVAAQEAMARVPLQGRFMIIPEWFHGKMLLANLPILTDNMDLYLNGRIGRYSGFDLALSENVSASNTTTWDQTRIIAGIRGQSFAVAAAINKTEQYRVQGKFQDAVQGLYIYGAKMMRPDMTLTIYADKTAEA